MVSPGAAGYEHGAPWGDGTLGSGHPGNHSRRRLMAVQTSACDCQDQTCRVGYYFSGTDKTGCQQCCADRTGICSWSFEGYAVKTLCASCHSSCRTCDDYDRGSCTSCYAGYYFDIGTFSYDTCEVCTANSHCASGHYCQKWSNAPYECLSCYESCATCDGGGNNNCKTCKPGFYLSSRTHGTFCEVCLQDSHCASWQYCSRSVMDPNSCAGCYPTCKTCNGGTDDACLTCDPAGTHRHRWTGYVWGSYCVRCLEDSHCTPPLVCGGTFLSPTDTFVCKPPSDSSWWCESGRLNDYFNVEFTMKTRDKDYDFYIGYTAVFSGDVCQTSFGPWELTLFLGGTVDDQTAWVGIEGPEWCIYLGWFSAGDEKEQCKNIPGFVFGAYVGSFNVGVAAQLCVSFRDLSVTARALSGSLYGKLGFVVDIGISELSFSVGLVEKKLMEVFLIRLEPPPPPVRPPPPPSPPATSASFFDKQPPPSPPPPSRPRPSPPPLLTPSQYGSLPDLSIYPSYLRDRIVELASQGCPYPVTCAQVTVGNSICLPEAEPVSCFSCNLAICQAYLEWRDQIIYDLGSGDGRKAVPIGMIAGIAGGGGATLVLAIILGVVLYRKRTAARRGRVAVGAPPPVITAWPASPGTEVGSPAPLLAPSRPVKVAEDSYHALPAVAS
eukprot:jgi/Mesvir1/27953/Mv20160-RA.1